MSKSNKDDVSDFRHMFSFLNDTVGTINNSKLFAGIMIIILNIASKFVSFRLSKSMEAYLKYTFSRNVLVFAMAWMGTRDIITACIITLAFIICMEYLFNEESMFCVLSNEFKSYHVEMFESGVSEEEYKKAHDIIAKYEEQHSEPVNAVCDCQKKNKVVVIGSQVAGAFSNFSG